MIMIIPGKFDSRTLSRKTLRRGKAPIITIISVISVMSIISINSISISLLVLTPLVLAY